ncbi:unnamed protein product [Moneuplotes crassus]|uniref:Uncharacterized protein n=1 Tax=Euplotes crassus TaxID=5936 RepID=A0AAD1XZR8_EUPCR|nr:unnamed protein product [Moneuplotes crassus]
MSSKTVAPLYNPLDVSIDDHEDWKNQVLRDYYDTKESSRKVLMTSQFSKDKMEKDLGSIQTLRRKWDRFEASYKRACHRLNERIIEEESGLDMAKSKTKMQASLRNKFLQKVKRSNSLSPIDRM